MADRNNLFPNSIMAKDVNDGTSRMVSMDVQPGPDTPGPGIDVNGLFPNSIMAQDVRDGTSRMVSADIAVEPP